jgi:hypothetical protein
MKRHSMPAANSRPVVPTADKERRKKEAEKKGCQESKRRKEREGERPPPFNIDSESARIGRVAALVNATGGELDVLVNARQTVRTAYGKKEGDGMIAEAALAADAAYGRERRGTAAKGGRAHKTANENEIRAAVDAWIAARAGRGRILRSRAYNAVALATKLSVRTVRRYAGVKRKPKG